MDKNYVYIGMIVEYMNSRCLVIDKADDRVQLLVLLDNSITEARYDQISAGDMKEYNRTIREKQSMYSSKLVKNDNNFVFDNGSHIWFTSDTHFCHKNIIDFCDRPWGTVSEMDEGLIQNWNSCVGPDDTVFHLGDFCWGGSAEWNGILQRLNGHIHLILGNHDIKNIRQGYMKYFESVSFQSQITIEDQSIYLNHYPFLTYAGIYRDQPVWQLFGHIHSKNGKSGEDTIRAKHLLPSQYDVGVDNNNYKPVSFNQIKEIITSQIYQDYE